MPALAVSTTTDLVRFLLARIDEDDAELRHLVRSHTRGTGPRTEVLRGIRSTDRLRADCEAKRQVIGTIQQLLVLRDLPLERPVRDAAGQMLRAMATPYSRHPEFRSEWRTSPRH